MNRRFVFEVFTECAQFWVKDETAEDELDWTKQESDWLLAVKPGIVGVGTVRDGVVQVVLEISDAKPTDDVNRWDRVAECSLNLQSGGLVVVGFHDLDFMQAGPRIDLEPSRQRSGRNVCLQSGRDQLNVDDIS